MRLLKDAAEPVDFFDFVLRHFGKTKQNISPLIEYKANIHRALGRDFDKKFIGFHSHLLNLALHKYLETTSHIINKAHVLVKIF